MAIVVQDTGADAILKAYFNNDFPADKSLVMKLFSNNMTPADTDSSANYTEVTGGGYVVKGLSNGSWTVNTANDPSDAVYAEQTWTFTGVIGGTGIIYGYYVVDTSNNFIWSEAISPTMTPTNNGDQLKITPKFRASKGTPA